VEAAAIDVIMLGEALRVVEVEVVGGNQITLAVQAQLAVTVVQGRAKVQPEEAGVLVATVRMVSSV
jgi:hypothetical protein